MNGSIRDEIMNACFICVLLVGNVCTNDFRIILGCMQLFHQFSSAGYGLPRLCHLTRCVAVLKIRYNNKSMMLFMMCW